MKVKRTTDDLAACGGPKAFAEPLHVGRPNIGDRDRVLARIAEALDRRWLTNDGPLVQEFERRVAEFVGVPHCVAMCNATVALEIAIRAAGLEGEVIVPSYTFVATAHALQWQQITPVFCDIDEATHTLDPRRVEEKITPRTTGIIGVHLWGRAAAVEELEQIAQRRGLVLMFDAAHAFGASHRGRMVGGFGLAEVFSFHATKFFNTFEGGAVVTHDDDLARRMRLMRNFGFAGYDEVIYIGTNGKMSEVSAAMGLTSFESLEAFVLKNRENHRRYRAALAGVPGLTLLEYDEREHNNFQYVVVEVDADRAGLTRDQLVELLWSENVLARRYFWPGVHRMEPYRTLMPDAGRDLPVTRRVAERVLLLPTGTAVAEADVEIIGSVLRVAVANAAEVRKRRGAAGVRVVP